jgi:hypothetical protein
MSGSLSDRSDTGRHVPQEPEGTRNRATMLVRPPGAVKLDDMERRLRISAVVLILGWFFLPGLRDWIPLWVPFLAFAALELNFLVAGLRERGATPPKRGRLPQASDIDELGGEEWLEPVLVEVDGRDVWLPEGAESEEDVAAPRPARPRAPLLGRLEGVLVVAALAFVLLVLVPRGGWDGVGADDRERTEALLSAEAGRIAGHDASIHCDARREAVGVVQHADGIAEVGGRNAYLTPEICFRLYRLAFKEDEGPFSQTARAIAVLAHEAWHLHGERDEGIANCYGFQSGVALGRQLGLSEATAARMMRQQLVDNATLAQSAPEYLVPRECRNGGRLDLAPDESRFP